MHPGALPDGLAKAPETNDTLTHYLIIERRTSNVVYSIIDLRAL
jgi:hypothetical protein